MGCSAGLMQPRLDKGTPRPVVMLSSEETTRVIPAVTCQDQRPRGSSLFAVASETTLLLIPTSSASPPLVLLPEADQRGAVPFSKAGILGTAFGRVGFCKHGSVSPCILPQLSHAVKYPTGAVAGQPPHSVAARQPCSRQRVSPEFAKPTHVCSDGGGIQNESSRLTARPPSRVQLFR